jgi:hypothetical protein
VTAPPLPRQWWRSEAFTAFLPHLKAVAACDVRAGKHARLELANSAPWPLAVEALGYRAPCVACGRVISPFRARATTPKRGRGIGTVYLAVACKLQDRIGCSRGREASAAYDEIEALIAAERAGEFVPTQGVLW